MLVDLLAGQRNRIGGGVAAAMGNAHQELADLLLLNDLARPAGQRHNGTSLAIVADFNIAPAYPAAPSGAQRLEHRFLGGPAAGEVLRRLPPALAITDLMRRIDAGD